MKINIIIFIFTLVMTSCGSIELPSISKKESMALNSIGNELNCKIAYGTTKVLLRFSKTHNIDLTISNASINKDSFAIISKIIAERFYPNIKNKEKYKYLHIIIKSKSEDNIGTSKDFSYFYKLDK